MSTIPGRDSIIFEAADFTASKSKFWIKHNQKLMIKSHYRVQSTDRDCTNLDLIALYRIVVFIYRYLFYQ